jgi:hypothetical protein
MRYIEELVNGDCFVYNTSTFIITIDFDKIRNRLCIDLATGIPRWFSPETMVEKNPIFILDNNNNILPIKQELKNDNIHKN